MSKERKSLEWLTDYINWIERADASCEQKLILPELRAVKNLLSKHIVLAPTVCETEPRDDFVDFVDKIRSEVGKIEPMVVDYLHEFIEELVEQLAADAARWGNTWLNRSKEGQELRTKARYMDYFDMFEHAGIPMPWMKIVGGALICWIRENHPELCTDVKETSIITVEDFKNLLPLDSPEGRKKQLEEYGGLFGMNTIPHEQQCRDVKVGDTVFYFSVKHNMEKGSRPSFIGAADIRLIEAVIVKEILTSDKPKIETTELEEAIADATIEALGHGGPCKPEKPVDDPNSSAGVMTPFTYAGDPEPEKSVEDMTTKELVESPVQHKSDCAVHNEPAMPASECDCQDRNLPELGTEESKKVVE